MHVSLYGVRVCLLTIAALRSVAVIAALTRRLRAEYIVYVGVCVCGVLC
jgi:hypothetical protein